MLQILYASLKLLQSDKPASEKYWALEKSTRLEKKNKGVLIELSKSNVLYDTVYFLVKGVTVSNLNQGSLSLNFEDDEKKKKRNNAVDALKARFGFDIITRGTVKNS